jgi:hypothetical protein
MSYCSLPESVVPTLKGRASEAKASGYMFSIYHSPVEGEGMSPSL